MKKIVIAGLLFGVVGIVAFRSWWVRAGALYRGTGVVEPIENFLPVRPASRPAVVANSLSKIMKAVDYRNRPLKEVIEDIRKETGANILVEWKELEASGVEASAPVNVQAHDLPARRVLDVVLSEASPNLGLWTSIDGDGVVTITTLERLPYVLRVYNVRDILVDSIRFQRSLAAVQPEPKKGAIDEERAIEDLLNLIKVVVLRETWLDNGGKCLCGMVGGKLFVTQTYEGHAQLEKLLEKCREK
ncbi:MAG: hypothetical protein ACHRHE_01135 [Tepidisphaerales bacterium]